MKIIERYPATGEKHPRHRCPKTCPRCIVEYGETVTLDYQDSEFKSIGVHGMPDLHTKFVPPALLCGTCGWWVEIEDDR